ncbi:MAG: citrate transporter [Clostridia bacterium]|nr:citrate transporter [Clostridia bacterium]
MITHARGRSPLYRVHELLNSVVGFFRSNVVLTIALCAAGLSMVLVPPDAAYASYFDYKTLTCLFTTLAVICALRNIHFFTTVAQKIVRMAGNLRMTVLAMIYITFIGSMLIANDMALLTFLPLGYFALSSTKKDRYMAPMFILQNIAANLGGMLTPFGNPQNLYLYEKFMIPNGEFMGIMLVPFIVAVALITVCCLFFPKEEMTMGEKVDGKLPPKKTALYLVLFASTLLIVFRVIPYAVGLVVIPLVLMFADREALRQVDYPLLLTFVAFFIFAGNMSRIDAVNNLFSGLLGKNTLLTAVASCQVISNVPSAILLSQFTDNYRALLMGVNIGGAGTLIASLASLITFREFTKHYPHATGKYVGLFSAFNFGFLIVLTIVCSFLV